MGFCGVLDNRTGRVDFSLLRRMCGVHKSGCAIIDGEYGVLCDGSPSQEDMQPIAIKHNGALYTAAIICDTHDTNSTTAQAVLEGYVEEGEGFIRGLDFPYALALYDGRCAELVLAKGSRGEKPLFYSIGDGAVYFSTSVRSLMNLFGGCVRVRKNELLEYIFGPISKLPDRLFCDIRSLRVGQRLLCSRLGECIVDSSHASQCEAPLGNRPCEQIDVSSKDIRKRLTDALFIFNYPQFDCFMPHLLQSAAEYKKNGKDTLTFYDATRSADADYADERAERIGAAMGIRLVSLPCERQRKQARELKAMEKELDEWLSELLDIPTCALGRLIDKQMLTQIEREKSIHLRIRRKGMLCQCAVWFDNYNLMLV